MATSSHTTAYNPDDPPTVELDHVGASVSPHAFVHREGHTLDFPSVAALIADHLALVQSVLPDLSHNELVMVRHTLDALATRCTALMAELEHLVQTNALADMSDERLSLVKP